MFANTDVDDQFKLYTSAIPRVEFFADEKSLSEYGITTPHLIVVEVRPGEDVFSEEKWMTEVVSVFMLQFVIC